MNSKVQTVTKQVHTALLQTVASKIYAKQSILSFFLNANIIDSSHYIVAYPISQDLEPD